MQVSVTNRRDGSRIVCHDAKTVYDAVLGVVGSKQVACIVSGWASHAKSGDSWTIHNVDVLIEKSNRR